MTTILTPILLFSTISTNIALKRITTLSAQLHEQNCGSKQGYQFGCLKNIRKWYIYNLGVCLFMILNH
jgi:hypothetical protein